MMKQHKDTPDSGHISSIDYDPETTVLTVWFRTGNTFDYVAVPSDVAADFFAAPSAGKFFNANIRGRYVSTKREAAPVPDTLGEQLAASIAVAKAVVLAMFMLVTMMPVTVAHASVRIVNAGTPVTAPVVSNCAATAQQLAYLPGIGPKLAARIVEYRRHAAAPAQTFKRVSEIMEVKGIGEAKFRAIEPFIVVTGSTTARAKLHRTGEARR